MQAMDQGEQERAMDSVSVGSMDHGAIEGAIDGACDV